VTGISVKSHGKGAVLWASLLLYVLARVCQVYADRLPSLLIVVLHVVPPAIFALVHGKILYRARGIAAFALLCLGIGGVSESLSLRTGFPFGNYFFTDVMGPKILQLPVLLVLAYLGIGYCSWVVSVLISRQVGKPISGVQLVMVPMLAAGVMLAWDLAMEADWATVDRAWIWIDGGRWYGVPLSNFLGWYLTAYLIFQSFALLRRDVAEKGSHALGEQGRLLWRMAVLVYLVCALGNLLIPLQPMAGPMVADATGKVWVTRDLLIANGAVSMLVMVPLAALAWVRTECV
jgi:uncharacterized membrane protein